MSNGIEDMKNMITFGKYAVFKDKITYMREGDSQLPSLHIVLPGLRVEIECIIRQIRQALKVLVCQYYDVDSLEYRRAVNILKNAPEGTISYVCVET